MNKIILTVGAGILVWATFRLIIYYINKEIKKLNSKKMTQLERLKSEAGY
jgi:prefoldin subunit 5